MPFKPVRGTANTARASGLRHRGTAAAMIARRPSKTRLEPAGGAHGGLTERGKARAAVSAAVRSTLAWMRSPAGAVLVLLVLQSTSIVLLMRHSKTMVRAPGTGPAYPSSVAIFLAELLKMPLCLGMAAWTMHGDTGLTALTLTLAVTLTLALARWRGTPSFFCTGCARCSSSVRRLC